jgi:hypothetical protein
MSVRMEQFGSQKASFLEMWYSRLFQKPVKKIQVLLKSGKNKFYFIQTPTYIMKISAIYS